MNIVSQDHNIVVEELCFRDCLNVGDLVKLGEPSATSVPRSSVCTPNGDRPVFADCWYNCTLEDISGEDKKQRLKKV
ncbi:hypothetical protein ZIOFF_032184 [Zingiber officinale]|uniref:Uncharacterized protein n=1 Tax=Zingiber officinale TaxID=94328 RepID=A0A8J5GG19_ZINOF|nr:hypothetical protein ZIOFF_032184 [Zingiber officinale]